MSILNYSIKNGHIFYENLKDSRMPWLSLYKKGKNEFDSIPLLNFKNDDQIGQELISLGEQELEKESSLIRNVLGGSTPRLGPEDYKLFISKFNEILISKKNYEKMLLLLNNAIKSGAGEGSRSPMISSYFTSYLEKHLSIQITNFNRLKTVDINTDFLLWKERLEEYINRAIDNAIVEMLSAKEKFLDNEQIWIQLLDFYRSSQSLQKSFRNMIYTNLNLSSLINLAQKSKTDKKSGYTSRKEIRTTLKMNEQKARSVGGYVQEYISSMFNGINVSLSDKGNTRVLSNNVAKTDQVTLVSFNGEINTNQLLEQLDEEMFQTDSLKRTRKILQDFYDRNLSKVNNSFIIYTSTKSYSLSDGFRGFHAGGAQPVSTLVETFEEIGISAEHTREFLCKLSNTMNGAIGSNSREKVKQELSQAISEAIAYLLFDDWSTLGNLYMGAEAIHVFSLDGIMVPLSYLLINLGKAMIDTSHDMKNFVKASIRMPSIKYENQHAKTWEEIQAWWEDQAEEAKKEIKYSVTFLSNFKNLIKNLM